MIKNYLRSACKNLIKNKVITLINLIGLAIGITGLFLVLVFTSHEQSYDTFCPDHDRIYRVCQREMSSESESVGESTAPPLALELQSTIPEIENSCRYLGLSSRLITGPRHYAYEDNYHYIDPSFFEIFSIPVIQGNPEIAIQNPDNLVITKRIAERYFGTTEVLGKTLKVRDQDLTVGAVIENPPSYSHLQYDILRTMYTIDNEKFHSSAWLWHALETYVKLLPDAHIEQVQKKVYVLSNDGAIEQFKDAGLDYTFFLQPLSMIRKEILTDDGIVTSSSARNVVIFQLLGIFVLFLACLNFINMTLALHFKRTKEVSIRKVLGAFPGQVFHQFLLESMLTIVIAGILSIICIELILPSFLNLTGIPVMYLQDIPISKIIFFIMIVILSGIAAGIYPAFYASSHSTARALGHTRVHFSSKILRPVLVILQFTISIVIIIVMLSMKQQITYIQNRDLGYNSSHKLVLTMRRETELPQKYETYKDIFSSIPRVNGITSSSTLPGRDQNSFYIESNDEKIGKVQSTMYCYSVDSDFLPVYDIELIEGRNFDQTIDTNPSKVFLISESGVRHLKWTSPQDALGQEIVTGNGGRSGKIVGVFKDFNFNSLHFSIEPLFMEYYPDDFEYFTLNVQSKNLPQLMEQIQDVWRETFPNIPFKFFFADTAFNDQYNNEMKAISLMRYFSFLAIFIACSGLIGISLFIFQLRTREIGIRKVLGASLPSLIKLLNQNFIFWVALANLLAFPLAYIIIRRWLHNFAYRTSVDPTLFILAGCITIVLAMLILSFQTVRTAQTNPAEVIKYE